MGSPSWFSRSSAEPVGGAPPARCRSGGAHGVSPGRYGRGGLAPGSGVPGAGAEMQLGSRCAGRTFGAGTSARVERRAIVSESQVHVGDETEDAPVTDGEVGEADVFGEVEEPEEPNGADETDESAGNADATSEADPDVTGGADLAADDADAAEGTDGADTEDDADAEDGAEAADAVADGAGAAVDGAADLDPVARFAAEL